MQFVRVSLPVLFLIAWASPSLAKSFPFFYDTAHIQHAVYYLSAPAGSPETSLKRILKDRFPGFKLVAIISKKPTTPEIAYKLLGRELRKSYAPQSPKALKYFGRGLNADQILRYQKSPAVLILDFAFPARNGMRPMKRATELMAALAEKCDCLIWDENTRETFAVPAWRDKRLKGWDKDLPVAKRHFVVHLYRRGDKGLARAISLGMAKFGLPDIVINDFSVLNGRQMNSLINVLAQRMVEGAKMQSGGFVDIDLNTVKHPVERRTILASLKSNAEKRVKLPVGPGKREQGDPQNIILEIKFPGKAGQGLQERQDALISRLFGSKDELSKVSHNQAILAASKRARAKLPQLYRDFKKGFAFDEHLLLKAPFTTSSGGKEWMWVEVLKWDGKVIKGILQNDPYDVPGLKSGARVTINQDHVFDYIRRHAGGRSEGNETGQLILKYRKSTVR